MSEVILPVTGMHCHSCEIVLTKKLRGLPGVQDAVVSLKNKTATVTGNQNLPAEAELRWAIEAAGYAVGRERQPWFSKKPADYRDFAVGVIIVGLLALLVSRLPISALSSGSLAGGSVLIALLVGLTAGLSTCMALVGGLVLGISVRFAEKRPDASAGQKFQPHIFFNLGRVVAFFILGGVIGRLGSAFQLQGIWLGMLMIGVGMVMFWLGLQLTNLLPRLSANHISLPAGLSYRLGLAGREAKAYSHGNSLALGAFSFFLPCGFTQAMQLYAISTGSFLTGALVMGLFAIGTMPGLLGIGGLTAAMTGRWSNRFFKLAGVAVMAMALVNLGNGYRLTGWQSNFKRPAVAVSSTSPSGSVLATTFTLSSDIVPSTFTIEHGKSYTLAVAAKDDGSGCMSTIMIPGLVNDPQFLKSGQTNQLTFTAKKAGTYQITCAMGVPRGVITVI